MKMPFGKYKGREVKKLPGPYVFGLLKNIPIKSQELKKELLDRLIEFKVEHEKNRIASASYASIEQDEIDNYDDMYPDFDDLC